MGLRDWFNILLITIFIVFIVELIYRFEPRPRPSVVYVPYVARCSDYGLTSLRCF